MRSISKNTITTSNRLNYKTNSLLTLMLTQTVVIHRRYFNARTLVESCYSYINKTG